MRFIHLNYMVLDKIISFEWRESRRKNDGDDPKSFVRFSTGSKLERSKPPINLLVLLAN